MTFSFWGILQTFLCAVRLKLFQNGRMKKIESWINLRGDQNNI